jgi:hypothetical protein
MKIRVHRTERADEQAALVVRPASGPAAKGSR